MKPKTEKTAKPATILVQLFSKQSHRQSLKTKSYHLLPLKLNRNVHVNNIQVVSQTSHFTSHLKQYFLNCSNNQLVLTSLLQKLFYHHHDSWLWASFGLTCSSCCCKSWSCQVQLRSPPQHCRRRRPVKQPPSTPTVKAQHTNIWSPLLSLRQASLLCL